MASSFGSPLLVQARRSSSCMATLTPLLFGASLARDALNISASWLPIFAATGIAASRRAVATISTIPSVRWRKTSLPDAIAGSSRFILAGHDRGGRVAHRLVLDHPDAVSHLVPLNIISSAQTYARADKALATSPTRALNPALMSNRRPVAYVDMQLPLGTARRHATTEVPAG
jgi:hypothetical protein